MLCPMATAIAGVISPSRESADTMPIGPTMISASRQATITGFSPVAPCFAPSAPETLTVDCPPELLEQIPQNRREALLGVLAQDPRPSYQDDPGRVYGMAFAGFDVRFRVDGTRLTICEIVKEEP